MSQFKIWLIENDTNLYLDLYLNENSSWQEWKNWLAKLAITLGMSFGDLMNNTNILNQYLTPQQIQNLEMVQKAEGVSKEKEKRNKKIQQYNQNIQGKMRKK